MPSRRRPKHLDSYSVNSGLADRFAPVARPNYIISVPVILPRPVALRARRKIYTYPLPFQKRLSGRVIRKQLRMASGPLVATRVRIRVPAKLGLAMPSYVSISRGRLNVHSRKQLRQLYAAGEVNRRRYEESKTNRRRARHGQLDSGGSTAYGAVAAAARSGRSINQIADAALAARAILYSR